MAVIEVHELSKRFGAVTAVDQLSFQIGPGTITGFLGPNGAGKTTTLRMLLGLVRPDSGQATIWGRRYAELGGRRRSVGAVLEALRVPPRPDRPRSAADPVRRRRHRRSRIDAMLDVTGLAGLAGRRAGRLSLGERQRLGLAGALLGDPGVLILDEPGKRARPGGRVVAARLLSRAGGRGADGADVSHLLAEVAQLADKVIVIDGGRLVAPARSGSSPRPAGRSWRSGPPGWPSCAVRWRPRARVSGKSPRSAGDHRLGHGAGRHPRGGARPARLPDQRGGRDPGRRLPPAHLGQAGHDERGEPGRVPETAHHQDRCGAGRPGSRANRTDWHAGVGDRRNRAGHGDPLAVQRRRAARRADQHRIRPDGRRRAGDRDHIRGVPADDRHRHLPRPARPPPGPGRQGYRRGRAGVLLGLAAAATATGIGLGCTAARRSPLALPAAAILRYAPAPAGAGLLAAAGVGAGSLIRHQVGAISRCSPGDSWSS